MGHRGWGGGGDAPEGRCHGRVGRGPPASPLPGGGATEAPGDRRAPAGPRPYPGDLRRRCGNGWYGGYGIYRANAGIGGEVGLPDPTGVSGEGASDANGRW